MNRLHAAGPPRNAAGPAGQPRARAWRTGGGRERPAQARAGDPNRAYPEQPGMSDMMAPGAPNGGGSLAAAARRRRQAGIAGPPARIMPPQERSAVSRRMVNVLPPQPPSTVHRVRIKTGQIELNGYWPELRRAMMGHTLSLKLVTSKMLERIDDDRLYDLCDQLGRTRQKAHWHLKNNTEQKRHFLPNRIHRSEVSGVSALVLLLWAAGGQDQASRLLLTTPVEVGTDLAEAVPALFTLNNIANIFLQLVPMITSSDIEWDTPEDEQINAMGSMIAAFLTVNAKEKPELLELWVVALIRELEDAGYETTSENLGLLAGTVLAGAYKYARSIRKYDEKRYYVIDKTSLLVFAASNFVPLSFVVAGLAVVSVGVGIAFEKYFVIRDFNKFATALEGRLRVRLLKAGIFESSLETGALMDWLVSALRCNDLSD